MMERDFFVMYRKFLNQHRTVEVKHEKRREDHCLPTVQGAWNRTNRLCNLISECMLTLKVGGKVISASSKSTNTRLASRSLVN
jgi:hypothetical protein